MSDKRRFYILSFDIHDEAPEPFVNRIEPWLFDQSIYQNGKQAAPGAIEEFSLIVDRADKPWSDNLGNNVCIQLASQKLVDALGRAQNDFKSFPAPLRDAHTGKRIFGYSIINPIRGYPSPDDVLHEIYRDLIPENVHMFQLTNDCPHCFVSEEVKRDLERCKLRNVGFVEARYGNPNAIPTSDGGVYN